MVDLNLDSAAQVHHASFIKEIQEDAFEKDVLVASMKLPVIVVFCGADDKSCKQVLADLEKAAIVSKDSLKLIKININKNMSLAQAMQIETLPTLYAFFQGKPVDGIAGNKTEDEISSFIEKIKKLYCESDNTSNATISAEEIKKTMDTADEFFQDGKYDEALGDYSIVLEADSKNMEALGGIGWCLISGGDTQSVKEMLENLSRAELKNSRLKGLAFILSMEEKAKALGDIESLEKEKSIDSIFDLSICYLAASKFKEAIDTLISIIKENREWEEKKANKLLLEIFEAFGEFHPLTSYGRRQLSAILFS